MRTKFERWFWRGVTSTLFFFTVGLTLGMLASCATFQRNPADTEVQATRKLALQVFNAVEIAGQGVVGVQKFEIALHDAKRVSDDTHRTFQTDLLITARIVRTALTQIQAATRVPELKNTVQVIIDNLNDLKTKYGAEVPDLATMLGIMTAGLSVVMAFLG